MNFSKKSVRCAWLLPVALAAVIAGGAMGTGRALAADAGANGGAGAVGATSLADRPTVIVVVGVQGEPEYGEQFAKAADLWEAAAKRAGGPGSGGANFVAIGRDALESNRNEKDETQDIDKSKLHKAIDDALNETVQPLWIVLIGHGTYDGKEAKFNLRGSDVSDAELAAWLKPCTRPLAVIDGSSSSAPFMNKLAGKGRVIVTATRTGQELNFARFGLYFAAAIGDPASDIDKDGEVSLLEAYLSASHSVAEFYKGEGRIITEHALLDDNGDGLGITADWFQGVRVTQKSKDGKPVDGTRAHQWALIRSTSEAAMPQELRARRDELELQLEALRNRKTALAEDDYYAQLDGLLLALARIYHEQGTGAATKPAAGAGAAAGAVSVMPKE